MTVWHDFLYTPLLNVLFFLYDGPAMGNFGLAIIELTVLLRIVLLPFTVVDERSRFRYEKVNLKVEEIDRNYKADHVMRKEKIRELLKEQKVSYWSKIVVLGVQVLVIVLLYQVFIGGIKFTPNEALYSWVTIPTTVNTDFFGFDLSNKYLAWPAAVAVYLFVQMYITQKQRAHLVTKSDVMFLIFFPIFTFIALMLLPMMKSLFVLTSLVFSSAVFLIRKLVFKTEDVQAEE